MIVLTGTSNPGLRQVSRPVETDKDRRRVARAIPLMHKHLREHGGVGLAGPQVGIPLRFFIWHYDKYHGYAINPRLYGHSDELWSFREGCLSLPRQFATLDRPYSVSMGFEDLHGAECVVSGACDLLGRIFQHEVDHLDGILFLDRVA